MGLDIRPGGASWSYSGFHEFRVRLAAEEGFVLAEMQGFGAPWRNEQPGIRGWDEIKSPLVPLLNHSDCEGYLDAYECEEMLPRLRQIAAKWSDTPNDPELRYNLVQLQRLIDGMEHAETFRCAVVFA